MDTLFNIRFELPFKSVRLTLIDDKKEVKAHASGFIRRENNECFLYTCWHVVTGYDRNDLKVLVPPDRKHIRIEMQGVRSEPGVEIVGGLSSFTLPLYSDENRPLWLQDPKEIPHPDLNAIGIHVPFWFDAVKLKLPDDLVVSDTQIIEDQFLFQTNTLLTPCDKVYLVGYPYGYSCLGDAQPTPVVITRHVAAIRLNERRSEVLLDGSGAPSMSGGPVFVERGESISLLGMYTGIIYPDYQTHKYEKHTALGACINMQSCWSNSLSLRIASGEY